VKQTTFSERLGAIRGSGAAAGGLVRAVVDGAGRLVDLVLAPEALLWPAGELAEEIVTAAGRAHDAAGEQLAAAAEQAGAAQVPGPVARLATELADATREADQRFDELATLAQDMLRQQRS
jgi:DNA-binding protein YbaB